jgi:hypothetical protein
MLTHLQTDISDAQNNLLLAKITHAAQANKASWSTNCHSLASNVYFLIFMFWLSVRVL